MLNTKAQTQWQFHVATIEAQNASAQSQANLARQTAQWQKAQSVKRRQATYGMAYHKSLQDNDDLFTDLAVKKAVLTHE